jgi:hypothetical protein
MNFLIIQFSRFETLTSEPMNGADSKQIRANVTDENIPSCRCSFGRSSLDVTWSNVSELAIAMRPIMASPSTTSSWFQFPEKSKLKSTEPVQSLSQFHPFYYCSPNKFSHKAVSPI